MKEIGSLLREAREEKGITLEQISKDTKISEKLLRDLEEGDFSGFAGKVYFKGALRNYAEYIGIDSGELFSLYDRIIEKNSLSPTHNNTNEKHTYQGEQAKKPIHRKAKKPFPFVVLIWIAVLTFVIGGSIWYRYDQDLNNGERVSYPNEFLPDESEEDIEEIIPDDEYELDESQPVEMPPEPVLSLLEKDNRQATYTIKEVEEKDIVLRFSGECWISVEQDGNFVEQGTFRSGDQHRISDGRETTIRFGNPPMAKAVVNGQEISLSGINNPFNLTIRKE